MKLPDKCNVCMTQLYGMQGSLMEGQNWGDECVPEMFFYCTTCKKMVGKTNGAIIEWFYEIQ